MTAALPLPDAGVGLFGTHDERRAEQNVGARLSP
jgi:hypothetical protein